MCCYARVSQTETGCQSARLVGRVARRLFTPFAPFAPCESPPPRGPSPPLHPHPHSHHEAVPSREAARRSDLFQVNRHSHRRRHRNHHHHRHHRHHLRHRHTPPRCHFCPITSNSSPLHFHRASCVSRILIAIALLKTLSLYDDLTHVSTRYSVL